MNAYLNDILALCWMPESQLLPWLNWLISKSMEVANVLIEAMTIPFWDELSRKRKPNHRHLRPRLIAIKMAMCLESEVKHA